MNQLVIGAGMFGGLLAVLSMGVPIAFALLFVALASLFVTGGGWDALSLVPSTYWGSVATFTLTSVPMFMFMGAIVSASGMGARLYAALATILDGVPGGLAVATTLACGVMAAVSGSSVATAAAIGGFAVSEMRRHRVPEARACGAVAAGGTLGILLPPSIPLIVYSVIAEQSIGKLFVATLIPGAIMASAFGIYQILLAMRDRARGSESERRTRPLASMRERVVALKDVGPFALLILIILGSLYRGLATPQEAASLGIVASLVLAGVVYRELSWSKFRQILISAAQSSVMILAVISSAIVFGYVMTTSQVAASLTQTVAGAHVEPWVLFVSINVLLIFLGCFMETIAIIVVTMPVLVPVVEAYHWNLIWFGVVVVINMEMALIHPPVGLNLFVVQSVAPDVPLRRIVLGTLPYVFIMMGVLALIGIFPSLSTMLLGAN
ncbi:TRAP transporter large permease subunit [Caballeronia sp. LP006]|uniref:TRAP transporter large permease n=1 Tax=unclassified Caballeronia TaxID=2646786 RepID=UPI001FD399B8|nr:MULTISPECIES: TRAP transporter large permease subunit [unclassified Caballeronia]MDR5800029.1 TRAP transporter large permease subunit [Caballeronia sp. LZ001]MDR5827813.1 TRAP transporter large permease subunit [Caballeronia sp. LP006]